MTQLSLLLLKNIFGQVEALPKPPYHLCRASSGTAPPHTGGRDGRGCRGRCPGRTTRGAEPRAAHTPPATRVRLPPAPTAGSGARTARGAAGMEPAPRGPRTCRGSARPARPGPFRRHHACEGEAALTWRLRIIPRARRPLHTHFSPPPPTATSLLPPPWLLLWPLSAGGSPGVGDGACAPFPGSSKAPSERVHRPRADGSAAGPRRAAGGLAPRAASGGWRRLVPAAGAGAAAPPPAAPGGPSSSSSRSSAERHSRIILRHRADCPPRLPAAPLAPRRTRPSLRAIGRARLTVRLAARPLVSEDVTQSCCHAPGAGRVSPRGRWCRARPAGREQQRPKRADPER